MSDEDDDELDDEDELSLADSDEEVDADDSSLVSAGCGSTSGPHCTTTFFANLGGGTLWSGGLTSVGGHLTNSPPKISAGRVGITP